MNAADVSLLNVTRDQVALRGFEQAVEGIRELERDIERKFEALERGIEGCHENGLEVMVKFSKPVDAAWASWRQRGMMERPLP